MRGLVRGVLYCSLWFGSIVAGFLFIACPLLPLLLVCPPRFRKCGDLLFSYWELYSTALLRVFGVKVIVSGHHIHPNESAVLIMNHRTRVDWNFLWAAMYQACMPSVASHKLKFILKDPIRHVPGAGWMMQMNGFLYITRRWEEDQGRLSRTLEYLLELRRCSQLLIFPEGTDLTKNSKQRSDKYALEHNLPQYSHTLHPKTTGFSYVVQHLQRANYLEAVYDLTIAYPDYIPQCEADLIWGRLPKEVHFYIERIPSLNIPKDDTMLRQWLEERWYNKEKLLKEFYERKTFPAEIWSAPKLIPLVVAFIFWSLLTGKAYVTYFTVMAYNSPFTDTLSKAYCIIFTIVQRTRYARTRNPRFYCPYFVGATVVLLIISPIFQLWAMIHAALFIGLSIFTTGFNDLEMRWYWFWRPPPKCKSR